VWGGGAGMGSMQWDGLCNSLGYFSHVKHITIDIDIREAAAPREHVLNFQVKNAGFYAFLLRKMPPGASIEMVHGSIFKTVS